MTEVTYANLKFENNHELDNISETKKTKEKGPPTSFRSCWPAVLILLMLCLTLLTALVTLAVLCQNCVLCPTNWNWKGGGTCYYLSMEKKSWEQSLRFCSSQNSTLLLIKEEEKLELVKKIPTTEYWLGLRVQQRVWYWADNTTLTEQQKSWVKPNYYTQCCGWVYYTTIYCKPCKEELHYICEKPAIQLQRCNNSCQEGWFVRPNDYEKLEDDLRDM